MGFMANENDQQAGGGAPQAAGTAGQPAQPSLQMLGQYVRDLSFENPGAPGSILTGTGAPGFNVGINVQVKRQGDDVYAVEITINAKAEREKALLFNIELVYGGAFRVRGFTDAQLPAILMVECPRLLFPFARQVLASVTQAGGFPPLLMEPVDFTAIYRQNLAAMAQAQKDQANPPSAPN